MLLGLELFIGQAFPNSAVTFDLCAGVIVALLAVPLYNDALSTPGFIVLVSPAFSVASVGASSAYLTVSEIYPLETRALAIALFFAFGTAIGRITGPALFGEMVHCGQRSLVAHDEQRDREIEATERAPHAGGPANRDELAGRVGASRWGPAASAPRYGRRSARAECGA